VIVNAARGGIIDDAALVQALKERRIAAAGLDVFEGEPKFNPGFLEVDNVALVPHIGSATRATRTAMAMLSEQEPECSAVGQASAQSAEPGSLAESGRR